MVIISENNLCLCFCLGGGTFDVSVVFIDGNSFTVKATDGNQHLGGQDIDDKLIDFCVHQFNRKNNKNVKSSGEAKSRLRAACEDAKRSLSELEEAEISIPALFDGINFSLKLSRARFNDLCDPFVRSTLTHLDKVLSSAGLLKSRIDEVVLVGGSSRILKVKQQMELYFGKKTNETKIDADEAGKCI